MFKKKFNNDFSCFQLRGKAAKACFVFISWRAKGKLIPKILSQFFLKADNNLIAYGIILRKEAVKLLQLFMGRLLHAYKKLAAISIAAIPLFDVFVKLLPAAQVEIANTKVRMPRELKRFLEFRGKLLFYVIEDTWHWLFPFR
ncbi:MAG: hypothetical protein OZ917_00305 [Candidatus Brocadiaceae bacterium]|nr:hypothetical protein [Candidatus Brocadiaceae bacterium]